VPRLLPLPRAAGRASATDARTGAKVADAAHPLTIEADGTIVYADGDCRAMIGVEMTSFDSLSESDQDRVCAAFNGLANSLAPGQAAQIVVESDPIDAGHVLDMVLSYVRTTHPVLREFVRRWAPALRAELARRHVPDRRGYILIGPAPEQKVGLAGALEGIKEALGLSVRRGAEIDRYGLDTAVDDVLAVCKVMDLAARRLPGPEVRAALWRAANPADPEPAALATVPAAELAATLTPPAWRETFDGVRVGAVHTTSFYVMEPPDLTAPGYADDLVSLDARLRLTWHLRGRERGRERTRQLKRRRRSAGVLRGQALRDLDTEGMGYEAQAQALELQSAGVNIVDSTLLLTLQAPDTAALERAATRARRVLGTRLAMAYGRGRGYQRRLWQAGLPFGRDVSRRARRWRTESIGNGLPFLAHSPGTATGQPLGFTERGGELALLDSRDASLQNSVMIVAGRSGSGKTFFTLKRILWLLLCGGRCTVIDRAGHYKTLIDVVGGTYVALGKAGEPPMVNLWDYRPGDDMRKKTDFVVRAHEIMLTNPGELLSPEQRGVLAEAVRHVYAAHPADHPAGPIPLEREMVAHIKARSLGAGLVAAERDMLRKMHSALAEYAGDGRYAALVDRATTIDLEAALLCFDLEGLPPTLYALCMFAITDCIARRAEHAYAASGGASHEMVVIDEGWFVMKYAGAGEWLDDRARRARHYALDFVFVTQQVSDLAESETASSLFNAASLKVLYRLQDVQSGGRSIIAWLAGVLQISEREAKALTQLRNGQMMLFRESKDGSYHRGVVNVMADPHERWMFSSEPRHDIPTRLRTIAEFAARGEDTWAAIKHLATTQP